MEVHTCGRVGQGVRTTWHYSTMFLPLTLVYFLLYHLSWKILTFHPPFVSQYVFFASFNSQTALGFFFINHFKGRNCSQMNWMFWMNLFLFQLFAPCFTNASLSTFFFLFLKKKRMSFCFGMPEWAELLCDLWKSYINGYLMELLLDVLLISVNSQIKLYFKKTTAHSPCLCITTDVIPQTAFKFNMIHTWSFYFPPSSWIEGLYDEVYIVTVSQA